MRWKLGCLFVTISALVAPPGAAQSVVPDAPAASVTSLQAAAARAPAGRLRVIVELGGPIAAPVPDGGATGDAALAASIRSQASAVAASALGPDGAVSYMSYSPMFAASASAEQIAKLAADPRVRRVVEDKADAPTLIQSLALIKATGAGNAHVVGARGEGRAVAILDSGVDKTHEFLVGKVISEACYSTTDPSNGSTSLCRRGAAATEAANSGLDCPSTISGCGHGTHVAGIAAGYNTSRTREEPPGGVAYRAGIIAIKVFSRFPASFCGGGSDCILSYTSDQIKGLERVYALRNGVGGRRIDAVNMSLGGGGSSSFCNSDVRKPIIDQLRAAGIATVISSGNNAYINGVSFPACIETATTVGSSTKASSNNPDRMSSFTNQGPQVDVLAPGGDFTYPYPSPNPANPILSSRFGAYAYLAGTSMAAPHIAGAFAAIRSMPRCVSKTVTQIETSLARTGRLITDHRIVSGFPQLQERRVDMMALLRDLGCL